MLFVSIIIFKSGQDLTRVSLITLNVSHCNHKPLFGVIKLSLNVHFITFGIHYLVLYKGCIKVV